MLSTFLKMAGNKYSDAHFEIDHPSIYMSGAASLSISLLTLYAVVLLFSKAPELLCSNVVILRCSIDKCTSPSKVIEDADGVHFANALLKDLDGVGLQLETTAVLHYMVI
ncbi:hypothetical protein K437DRAFT_62445 [Tilletiaria anomala UBC 951]|uniref:Uncharacterized protein n=1 Tax=Tilletiaria anomala (strain ATCC 24038 / CBS 436.72 / UBC 951) TaxID=1037660 RepID=A0A066V345_TILAU|nr:uncharacterized protein K437DRAFT_62445 [Tilletiaria anomala UBC 951]KDN36137.1 hypothetical protein K437DRAFT_62445 [Tilletiaria anomala UBC 951]